MDGYDYVISGTNKLNKLKLRNNNYYIDLRNMQENLLELFLVYHLRIFLSHHDSQCQRVLAVC